MALFTTSHYQFSKYQQFKKCLMQGYQQQGVIPGTRNFFLFWKTSETKPGIPWFFLILGFFLKFQWFFLNFLLVIRIRDNIITSILFLYRPEAWMMKLYYTSLFHFFFFFNGFRHLHLSPNFSYLAMFSSFETTC